MFMPCPPGNLPQSREGLYLCHGKREVVLRQDWIQPQAQEPWLDWRRRLARVAQPGPREQELREFEVVCDLIRADSVESVDAYVPERFCCMTFIRTCLIWL